MVLGYEVLPVCLEPKAIAQDLSNRSQMSKCLTGMSCLFQLGAWPRCGKKWGLIPVFHLKEVLNPHGKYTTKVQLT